MAVNKTSISAGLIIRGMLNDDEVVRNLVKGQIAPVAYTDEMQLPYITYRRASTATRPTKSSASADTTQIEVTCFAAEYDRSVNIAEAVRAVLDHRTGWYDKVTMRSCTYIDGEESYQDEAYVQLLIFEVRI